MVMVISLAVSTGPYHTTSMVAPAPCVVRRRTSSFGKEEPSLARPHFAGLPRLRHGIISPPLALSGGGVGVRPVRVRPFPMSIRAPTTPVPYPSYLSFSSRIPYPQLPSVLAVLSSYHLLCQHASALPPDRTTGTPKTLGLSSMYSIGNSTPWICTIHR